MQISFYQIENLKPLYKVFGTIARNYTIKSCYIANRWGVNTTYTYRVFHQGFYKYIVIKHNKNKDTYKVLENEELYKDMEDSYNNIYNNLDYECKCFGATFEIISNNIVKINNKLYKIIKHYKNVLNNNYYDTTKKEILDTGVMFLKNYKTYSHYGLVDVENNKYYKHPWNLLRDEIKISFDRGVLAIDNSLDYEYNSEQYENIYFSKKVILQHKGKTIELNNKDFLNKIKEVFFKE